MSGGEGSSWSLFPLSKKHIVWIHPCWTPRWRVSNMWVSPWKLWPGLLLKLNPRTSNMQIWRVIFSCSLQLQLLWFRQRETEREALSIPFLPLSFNLWGCFFSWICVALIWYLGLCFGWDSLELFSPQLQNMFNIWGWVCWSPANFLLHLFA